MGREALVLEMRVVIVSTVVTPNITLAGVAPRFSLVSWCRRVEA